MLFHFPPLNRKKQKDTNSATPSLRKMCALLFFLFTLFSCCLSTDKDLLFNTQDEDSEITASKVSGLFVKHNLTTCGSVTGKPVHIGGDKICVTDFGGCISCWNFKTGARLWLVNITQYGFPNGYYSRVGMAYEDDVLYSATASYKNLLTPGLPGFGAWAFAINAKTGALKWKKQIATELFAIVTQDPIISGNSIYYGLSSGEASAPLIPGYQCCEFVGATLSLKMKDGTIEWNSPNIPDDLAGVGKYSGAASWGGRPVIIGSYIYTVSGQLYQTPANVAACNAANPLDTTCVDPRVLFNSVIKRKKNTGQIVAYFRASAADTWNIACYFAGAVPGCQGLTHAFDYDITNIMYAKKSRQLIATSKSGFAWFLDLDLKLLGGHSVVAGSAAGGYVWRGAVLDDKDEEDLRVFLPNANNARFNLTLPNKQNTTAGAWVAYDGFRKVKWITPAPNDDRVYGSVGITNDIVYGSTRYQGLLVFMRQSTGQILKTIPTAGAMIGTPTAIGNYIIWGAGPGNALAGAVDQKYVLVLALPGC